MNTTNLFNTYLSRVIVKNMAMGLKLFKKTKIKLK